MSSTDEPSCQTRLRELLTRRPEIKLHPTGALRFANPAQIGPHHFYKADEVLVSNAPGHLEAFEAAAKKLGFEYNRTGHHPLPLLKEDERQVTSPFPAATRYSVQGSAQSGQDLEYVLDKLNDASNDRFKVTPNHVLFSAQFWGMDPYGDPSLPKQGERPQLAGDGSGVVVAVVDSGVPRGHRQNDILRTIDTWPSEEEPWSYSGPEPVLVSPQGHGSFVTGVVRQGAANATVRSYRVVDTDGVAEEWYLGHQLGLVLATGARVINLSLAAPTRSDQSLMGLSALEGAALGERKGQSAVAPIVVAAAGNSHETRRWYPAADDWTISVGAVQLDGPKKDTPKRAPFSNFGNWVDVWAPGVDVVSSFEAKPFQTSSGQLEFDGTAVWSGTSFSAAHVSGKVAEIVQKNPRLGRDGVLRSLIASATMVPDVGPFIR